MDLTTLDLVTYEDFEGQMPGTSARKLMHLASRKKFPPFVRMTPRGEPLWARSAIADYLRRVYQPLLKYLQENNPAGTE